jgi:hypothetical protein
MFTVPGSNTIAFYRLHWINAAASAIVAPSQIWTWVPFTNKLRTALQAAARVARERDSEGTERKCNRHQVAVGSPHMLQRGMTLDRG